MAVEIDTPESSYRRTPRTTANRDRGRVSYDRAAAHAILDEAWHCHLGFVVDGEPRVLPTLHVRIGETVYVHGSTGSRPLLAARTAAGLRVCLAVTLLDGIVYGRSQFHHSANYRSVIAHGVARLVTDEHDKRRALAALVDRSGCLDANTGPSGGAAGASAGRARSTDSRPPSAKELAETAVLALPLTEVSVRTRTGGVVDEPADYALAHWAGVVPLRLVPGPPQPDAGVTAPLPAYLHTAATPRATQ